MDKIYLTNPRSTKRDKRPKGPNPRGSSKRFYRPKKVCGDQGWIPTSNLTYCTPPYLHQGRRYGQPEVGGKDDFCSELRSNLHIAYVGRIVTLYAAANPNSLVTLLGLGISRQRVEIQRRLKYHLVQKRKAFPAPCKPRPVRDRTLCCGPKQRMNVRIFQCSCILRKPNLCLQTSNRPLGAL